LGQDAADERVAARPLERKYVIEDECELLAQAISQHAPGAVQPRSDGFRLDADGVRRLLDACLLHVAQDEHRAKCRRSIIGPALQYLADLPARGVVLRRRERM